MRHPNHLPAPLPDQLKIDAAVIALEAAIAAKRTSKRKTDAGEFWLSSPAELNRICAAHAPEPCTPIGWPVTVAAGLAALATMAGVCFGSGWLYAQLFAS